MTDPENTPMNRVQGPRLPFPAGRSRLILGALLVPLLAACSLIELGYSQAPGLLTHRIDRAFDLGDWQKQQLRRRLAAFHEWHREQELAHYEALFTTAAERAEDGVDATEIAWLVDEVSAARDRAVERLIDDLAPLAMELKAKQVAHFRRYRAEDFEEDIEERRRPEWRDELAERRLERIGDWVGSLDDELEARALARLARVPDSFEYWGRYRAQRDALLGDTLERSASVEEMKSNLRRVLLSSDSALRSEFEAERRVYWQHYSAAIVDIIDWLPDSQRQRIVDKLRDYARIARSLRT